MADPTVSGYILPAASLSLAPSVAAALRAAAANAEPSSHTLRGTGPVLDQKNLPCCVSYSLSTAMQIRNPAWAELSPLFHYYVTRYDNGGANADGFLRLSDALAALSVGGICLKQLHAPPSTTAGVATRPTAAAYADGRTRALGRRGILNRYAPAGAGSKAVWAREQLARNHPVVLGIRLPASYPDGFLNRNFEWLEPDLLPSASGHCVLAVGYSDIRQALRIQDSRGPQAFDGGRWWMANRVVDSEVVQEAYCLLP